MADRSTTWYVQSEETDSVMDNELIDRILGTIYGNCIGDAIGLLTEFMSKEEGNMWYPEEKLEYRLKEKVHSVPHQRRWKTGDWTDDSDQMILIMRSLVDKKGKVDVVDFANKLLNWAKKGFPELGDKGGLGIGSHTNRVLKHKSFLTNPQQAASEVWRDSREQSAPNGAVMRTSVLGIHQFSNINQVITNTIDICTTTHSDPRCIASCIAVTTAISMMLHGKKHRAVNGDIVHEGIIEDAYHLAKEYLPDDDDGMRRNKLHEYMNKRNLSELKLAQPDNIGYTYKCLGAGFWALRQKDFREALTAIVKEGGDSDTNGAVAGALLGCKVGFKNLPHTWIEGLLHKKWLDEKIKKFMKMLEDQIRQQEQPVASI
ncbi:ADP-ribosyl-[dinitrogen reductase] glycohydrolase-like [Ptychodera flava]|uniref:ADP-ribosyl-[dinitrogen reductase] glycohydrolase-like n=1 Tax=Ptychodera flava TaxID=63121 RepID=UPI00396AA29A